MSNKYDYKLGLSCAKLSSTLASCARHANYFQLVVFLVQFVNIVRLKFESSDIRHYNI